MKKVFAALLMLSAVLLAAENLADVRGFSMGKVKLPIYNDQELQMMVFADSSRRQEVVLISDNTFIDLLLENVNVDRINDGWGRKLYPLNAPFKDVLAFWKDYHKTSKAVIFTPRSLLDQKSRVLSGSTPIFMRSPTFDLNGFGFSTDFKTQVTEVNSNVRIVARKTASDPITALKSGKSPAVYETLTATSDSLRLDMANDEIMLIGNVEVLDGNNKINCDRLTIFMDQKDQKVSTDSQNSMFKGVSRILAAGDVVITQLPEPGSGRKVQKAFAEHMEYELAVEKVILTGEDTFPRIVQEGGSSLTGKRIEILRTGNKLFATGGCTVVTGNETDGSRRVITSQRADFDGGADLSVFYDAVTVRDSQMTLNCDQMQIHLADNASQKSQKGKATEYSPVSGKQDIERIFCTGNVRIVEKLPADAVKGTVPKVITSKRCELNYKSNKLVFYENVKARDNTDTLDCDRLDLFLADKGAEAVRGAAPIAAGVHGSGKELRKVIASGKVFMVDGKSTLSTDLMTLNFRTTPKESKPAAGMFHSGGVQVTEIICDGKVVANSRNKAGSSELRILKADHAVSNLLTDLTEFHRNVSVKDGKNLIVCRDMYVYSRPAKDPAQKEDPDAEPDPDADPFALEMDENSAPSRIALTSTSDLRQIVWKTDVLLTNIKEDGKPQYVGGDTAVYTVDNKDIVVTAEAPRRPYIRNDGRKQFSDLIYGNLESEEFSGKGNIEVIPDPGY